MKKLSMMRESDQAYGRIEAFLHVAGYTIARAFADMEYLLDEKNRWKEFGFTEINEFLSSFNFKEIEANLESRKRLAKRIKELQPKASNRQIERTVGLGNDAVARATGKRKKVKENQSNGVAKATVPGKPQLSGAEVVKLAERTEAKVEKSQSDEQQRIDLRAKAMATLPAVSDRFALHNSVCSEALKLDAASFDWVITDPPYEEGSLGVYTELAKIAAHLLKNGGSLLCMVGQSYLPEVMMRLQQYLSYHWMLGYHTPGGQSAQIFPRKINTFWKPVLWFIKGEYQGDWIGDYVRSEVNDNDKRFHHWGQSESGMQDLMRRFVKCGDVVLDPFMGGGTTGIVTLALEGVFVGFDSAQSAYADSLGRIHEYVRTRGAA